MRDQPTNPRQPTWFALSRPRRTATADTAAKEVRILRRKRKEQKSAPGAQAWLAGAELHELSSSDTRTKRDALNVSKCINEYDRFQARRDHIAGHCHSGTCSGAPGYRRHYAAARKAGMHEGSVQAGRQSSSTSIIQASSDRLSAIPRQPFASQPGFCLFVVVAQFRL